MTILFLSCPREIHLCPRRRNDVHSIKSLKSERIHTMKKMRNLFTVLLAVAMTLAKNCPTKMRCVGVQDVFGSSGPAWPVLKKYGLSAENIVETVKSF